MEVASVSGRTSRLFNLSRQGYSGHGASFLLFWIRRIPSTSIQCTPARFSIAYWRTGVLKGLRANLQLPLRHAEHVPLDSVLATSTIAHDSYMELTIESVKTLPGTQTVILSLGEGVSKHPIEMYLHKKYYRLLDENVLVCVLGCMPLIVWLRRKRLCDL